MLAHRIFRFFYPENDPIQVKKKYGIPDKVDFKIEKKKSGWFVVTSPDLPGLITQSKDLGGLIDTYNDAILTYYDVPKRESDFVFNELNLHGAGQLSLRQDKVRRYA